MKTLQKFREKVRKLNAEVFASYLAYRHPQVSRVARLVIFLTVAYALSPIDLIPDFIPVFGFLGRPADRAGRHCFVHSPDSTRSVAGMPGKGSLAILPWQTNVVVCLACNRFLLAFGSVIRFFSGAEIPAEAGRSVRV